MQGDRHVSGEALLLFLLMLLGWATTLGMLAEHERDAERRMQGIEHNLCVLGARFGGDATKCPPYP